MNLGAVFNEQSNFVQMIEGTAARPYVFRQMLPMFANWTDDVTPVTVKIWLYQYRPPGNLDFRLPDLLFDSPIARSQTYFFRYLIVYSFCFLSTLLAVYAMYLVCKAMDFPPAATVLAPITVILLFPYLQSFGGYFYDFPELAFMALAVWIAIKLEWWWLIPIAALGTWNKESFLLFIPTLYPILRPRHTRSGTLMRVGVPCLISFAVYYRTHTLFANNPGGTTEVHWRDQLAYLTHPGHWVYYGAIMEKTYGILLPTISTILPLAFLAWTFWRGWRLLPTAIQRHGQFAAAINLPLYFLFCAPGELRNLSMLFIVFLLTVAGNLSEWMQNGE